MKRMLLCGAWAVLSGGCNRDVVTEPGPVPGVTVTVTDNPHNLFSRILDVQVDSTADVTVQIEHDMGTTQPHPPGEILVLGLAAGKTHALTVLVDGRAADTVEVSTPALDDDWQMCEAEGDFAPKEVVCTNGWHGEAANYMCVDRSGQPVWSLAHPDGEIMLAVRSLPSGGFAAVGDSKSMVAIFDERGALVNELTAQDLQDKTRFRHTWIDMHEIIAISEGAWAGAVAFLTASVDEYDDQDIVGNGIVVVDPDTLEVLWDWSAHGVHGDNQAIDPKMPYDRLGMLEEQHDWLHANALLHRVRPDGGEEMLVSLRSQDWIIAVDTETDEIRWRLGQGGDFAGDSDAWFFQQHAPELHVEGDKLRMFVFDNGNIRPSDEGFSRVIELELDEQAMTATLISEVGGFFVEGHGDADLLPGKDRLQYVIGWEGTPYVEEVSWPGGEPLWRLDCPEVHELYRATYFPSLYERTWWYTIDR